MNQLELQALVLVIFVLSVGVTIMYPKKWLNIIAIVSAIAYAILYVINR